MLAPARTPRRAMNATYHPENNVDKPPNPTGTES
ncbi:hypothetical protein BFJ71_g17801 [Fusarium oxysporum]|nr:hypothetical protein BFJ71_g17801 [Fusarium oxysporum]